MILESQIQNWSDIFEYRQKWGRTWDASTVNRDNFKDKSTEGIKCRRRNCRNGVVS
jgi:hypothetical protein